MAIAFYTLLKGESNGRLLTFATSRTFRYRLCRKGPRSCDWFAHGDLGKNCQVNFFSSSFTYLFIFNPFYKISEKLNNRKKVPYLFCSVWIFWHMHVNTSRFYQTNLICTEKSHYFRNQLLATSRNPQI